MHDESPTPKPVLTPDYLTVTDISRALHLDKETVRVYIRNRKLPAIRIGRDYRVHPDDYKQFLKECSF